MTPAPPRPITLDELRTVDLFDDLSDEQLQDVVAVVHPRFVAAGEILVEQGVEVDEMLLLI